MFQAGVDLSRVLLPPAENPLQALEITRYLVTEQGIGMVIFNDVADLVGHDPAVKWLSTTLRQTCAERSERITGALHQSPYALDFLTPPLYAKVSPEDYPSGFALAHYAAVRPGFKKTDTLRRRDGTRGFRVQVEVLKNKLASPATKPMTLDIYFNGAVETNGII